MTRWWATRWFIVPTLMVLVTLGWLVYVSRHDNGLIEGRIVDAAGRPVADATVRIFDRGFVTHQERGRTRSDADGRFRITDNTSHSVQLEAETPELGRSERMEVRLWFAAQDVRLADPLRLPAQP